MEAVYGVIGGTIAAAFINRSIEILTGDGIWEFLAKRLFRRVSRNIIDELRYLLQPFFGYNYNFKKDAQVVRLLPNSNVFFEYKTQLIESLTADSVCWILTGRPFLHLLDEEVKALSKTRCPDATAYFKALQSKLESNQGRFIYFVDPIDTVRQLIAKGYTKNHVHAANEALFARVDKYENLEMLVAPILTHGLDCITVNTSQFPNEVVLGHRPLGASTFNIGVRVRSNCFAADLRNRFLLALDSCRTKEKGNGLQQALECTLSFLV